MARVLLGVTGGIAAYKACELLRLLVKAGHEVVPLPTPGAERFVAAETLHALARRPASADPYPHLVRADLLVVAPCTANTLAKLAHGLADNVLTEAALAHRGPALVAPAMNPRMWAHAATQANAATLRARGVELVGPDEGELAEGEVGLGRMSEPDEIAARAPRCSEQCCNTKSSRRPPRARHRRRHARAARLRPLRRQPLLRPDGRRARRGGAGRGAEVTLLAANLTVPAPGGVEVVETPTAADLARETHRAADADLVLMAAAVADYRPSRPLEGKRPKDEEAWQIELEPTQDVLARWARAARNGQVLVGFAADESGRARPPAAKLTDKNVNFIVFNDVSRNDIGFDAGENEVTLLGDAEGDRELPRAAKEQIAAGIVDEIERLLEERRGSA